MPRWSRWASVCKASLLSIQLATPQESVFIWVAVCNSKQRWAPPPRAAIGQIIVFSSGTDRIALSSQRGWMWFHCDMKMSCQSFNCNYDSHRIQEKECRKKGRKDEMKEGGKKGRDKWKKKKWWKEWHRKRGRREGWGNEIQSILCLYLIWFDLGILNIPDLRFSCSKRKKKRVAAAAAEIYSKLPNGTYISVLFVQRQLVSHK